MYGYVGLLSVFPDVYYVVIDAVIYGLRRSFFRIQIWWLGSKKNRLLSRFEVVQPGLGFRSFRQTPGFWGFGCKL